MMNLHLSKIKKGYLFLLLLIFSASVFADAPVGYYDEAEGKSKADLKTALHDIIRVHTYLIYDVPNIRDVWWNNYFKKTDWHPDGYFWDMYSNEKRPYYSGSVLNREHNMPRSWWGVTADYPKYDANGDLHNLYPSDAVANGAKLNYPLGVVGSASYNNGVVKVGNNSFSGYSGIVFEPADEYKGDFARDYMYMVTCYQDYVGGWRSLGTSSMIVNNAYPNLTPYGIRLLMDWHRKDPVSTKEINRNEAVYKLQNNRNPFIDIPDFADFIWGDKQGETWYNNLILKDFAIYPNPASTVINIDLSMREGDTILYQIYALNGVMINSGQLDLNNQIALDGIPNGMYIIMLFSGNQRLTEKFIINNFEN